MRILVKVKPKAKFEKLEKLPIGDNSYLAHVTAAPEKGQANLALIKLLAGNFQVKKSDIKILKGFKKAMKIIQVNKV